MYEKDKNHRITLRLNEKQFEYVRKCSESLDVSPSDFLRMVVNLSISTYEANLKKVEGDGRENDKTDINNIL